MFYTFDRFTTHECNIVRDVSKKFLTFEIATEEAKAAVVNLILTCTDIVVVRER